MKTVMGNIEVICGSMFCGKSEELMRRTRRAIIAKQCAQLFKPIIDDRYGISKVQSHSGHQMEATPIEDAADMKRLLLPETRVVAVDEVQFFDWQFVNLVRSLAHQGLRVILAGLDTDFRGEPFGAMPELLCIAEDVTKLHAICTVCGEDASRTQRLVNGKPAKYTDQQVLIGAAESYEARCRIHHQVSH